MSGPTAGLLGAYARTAYAAAEGRAVARIGRRSRSVDALLRRLGTRQGAFVTAWNPRSRRMPRGWNDRALDRLRLASRRLMRAEGWGIGRSWAEAHLLLGADPRRVLVLARRFRQHAVVAVRVGAPARVVHARVAPVAGVARGPSKTAPHFSQRIGASGRLISEGCPATTAHP